jgi:MoaA/NifB/PqqE/SkfB family radical SAM enzyme
MEQYLSASVPLSVKPSIDGVGPMHDYIRGIPGNFVKLEETIDRLLAIKAKNPRLLVDLGTVISNFNLHHLPELEAWVHARGIGAYRHEIAEQRVEFHNIGDPITPPPGEYERLTLEFADQIYRNIKKKAFLTRVTEAIRVTYYHVAVQILKQRRQVTPCYGGLANIHLDYNGEMWPCCILGGEQSMGNVRNCNYDVQALLSSEQALKVKKYIADDNCACPLASQWLNNVLQLRLSARQSVVEQCAAQSAPYVAGAVHAICQIFPGS